MSFSFSLTAPDKQVAKDELCNRNTESGGHMPEDVKQAVHGLIDAMPDPPEGRAFNVATYGHFATEDNPGDSNITLSISHVLR